MAWRFVKQPNGLYARFSDIVGDFTDYDLTREEILEMGPREWDCGIATLERKIASADQDKTQEGRRGRFQDELETIRDLHGPKVAERRRAELSRTLPDAE